MTSQQSITGMLPRSSDLLDSVLWNRGSPPKDKVILMRNRDGSPASIASFWRSNKFAGGGFWVSFVPNRQNTLYVGKDMISHAKVSCVWEWIIIGDAH